MSSHPSAILSRLHQDSLVSLVPGFAELCLEQGLTRWLKPHEAVCLQGERLDQLIIPIFGGLRIHRTQDSEAEELGFLHESRSLALRHILWNEPVPYMATSDGTTQVLSLPVSKFLRHLEKHPDVHHYLKLITSSSGVRAFHEVLIERRLKFESICRIFSHISPTPLTLGAGQTLDMSRPSLWMVSSGSLAFGDHLISEGSFFGTEALSPHSSSPPTLRAQEPTLLYQADLAPMRPLLSEFGLLDALIVASHSRRRAPVVPALKKWDHTLLPGRPLLPSEVSTLQFPIDEKAIRWGTDDENNEFDSVSNFVFFLEHPVQVQSVELDLRLHGLSYASLAHSLEGFGYVCRATSCSIQELGRQPTPALVGYGPRWSVLLKREQSHWWLIDPIQGFLAVSDSDFRRHWNGEVFVAESATADWIPASETKPSRVIFAVLNKMLPHLGSLFGFKVLALALSASLPLLAGYLMDRLSVGAEWVELFTISLAGIFIFTLMSLATMAAEFIHIEMRQRFDFKLRVHFYRMTMRLKSTAKITLGKLCLYEKEFSRLSDFWIRTIGFLSFDFAAVLLFSAILATYDVRFPVLGIGLALLLTALRWPLAGPRRALYEKQLEASSRIRQLLTEVIGSIRTVKAAGAETLCRHAIERSQLEAWRLRLRGGLFQILTEGGLNFFSSLAIALTLYIATRLYLQHQIGIGEVMSINVLMMALLWHLQVIAAQIGEFEEIRASTKKMAEFFQLPTETAVDVANSNLNAPLSGHIEFDHVTFSYPGSSSPLFENLSFSIYPNQIVAIVGKSGSGKSTLTKLISGEVQATSGRIFLDGYDINSLSLECKRREIGVIQQKSELFAGSVIENIAYASDNPQESRARTSLHLVAADEFVENLHRGLNHHLAEGAVNLSGGERQRIAMARSIYANPNVYVFDEATSALDAGTEKTVIANMRKILAGRTGVIVAHRLTTIRAADRILVLNEGRLVEDGTHDELIAKKGHYADLFGSSSANMQRQAS